MATARIFQRFKSSMQSGKRRIGQWTLEFELSERKKADPLMGWSGSGDTNGQIQLGFPTLDAAVDYAKREGLTYHVVQGAESRLKLQTYADNFSKGPIA